MSENNKYPLIDSVKLFLLLGVVSIHSNILEFYNNYSFSWGGVDTVSFFSAKLTKVCVPAFFIISGFLFFRNQHKFSFHSYSGKLYRRLYTLLIPYILWNLISLVSQYIKIKYLGLPDHALFVDGNLSLIKVFKGFVNYVNGYPFAFAFWFIRNLMVFVVLSPVAYFLSCKKLSLGLIFIIGCCVMNTTLFGFSFFVIGGIISQHFKNYVFRIPFWKSLVCGIIWIGISIINIRVQFVYLSSTILIIESICALIFILALVQSFRGKAIEVLLNKMVPATFFIYAFHQLFCQVTIRFYIEIFGLDSSIRMVLAWFCSFISMVGISYLVWLALKRTCPIVVNVLCGNRGNSPS